MHANCQVYLLADQKLSERALKLSNKIQLDYVTNFQLVINLFESINEAFEFTVNHLKVLNIVLIHFNN